MMRGTITEKAAALRVCVAFLGEKSQNGWWKSDFLSDQGKSYLTHAYPRSVFLAQVNGAGAAAQIIHDESIGIGDVHHLFRLPEERERAIHEELASSEQFKAYLSPEAAHNLIAEIAGESNATGLGPFLVQQKSLSNKSLAIMAGAYSAAFQAGYQTFPYYRV